MQRFDRPSGQLGKVGVWVMVACMLMLAACGDKAKPAASGSQIAAQVNEGEISVHQVQAMLQLQPSLAASLGASAADKVLDALIEQELSAQAARKAGLDTSPKVLQAMELAKREVLARAYQDQLVASVALPDTESVNRYYEQHPELFAQRRKYFLQEIQIKAPPEEARAIKAQVEGLVDQNAINVFAKNLSLPHSIVTSTQWSEALSMDLLPKLAYLHDGQSTVIMRTDGLIVLTVLGSETVPVSRAQATGAIQAALMADKRKALIKDGVAALRKEATIRRTAAAGVGAASASAASAVVAPASR